MYLHAFSLPAAANAPPSPHIPQCCLSGNTEKAPFLATLLTEMQHTSMTLAWGTCSFLLYLHSSNVCRVAGVEPWNKRVIQSTFCFLFHSWVSSSLIYHALRQLMFPVDRFHVQRHPLNLNSLAIGQIYYVITQKWADTWKGPVLGPKIIVKLKKGKRICTVTSAVVTAMRWVPKLS